MKEVVRLAQDGHQQLVMLNAEYEWNIDIVSNTSYLQQARSETLAD